MHADDDFARLAAEGYNRVPVVFETLADLDTPLSVYLKIARGPYSYLLESAQGGEQWGRYSIIGLPCRTVLKVTGHRVTVTSNGDTDEEVEVEDPLAFIEEFQARYRVAPHPELPRFSGGLVGYFGYDCVRFVEKRLEHSTPPDPLGTPDAVLMVSEEIIVFDNLRGRMQLISLVDPAEPGIREQNPAAAAGAGARPGKRCLARRSAPLRRERLAGRPVPESAATVRKRSQRATSSPSLVNKHSRPPWTASASTPRPATSCRWCWRSGCRFPSPPTRWTSTGPCAA